MKTTIYLKDNAPMAPLTLVSILNKFNRLQQTAAARNMPLWLRVEPYKTNSDMYCLAVVNGTAQDLLRGSVVIWPTADREIGDGCWVYGSSLTDFVERLDAALTMIEQYPDTFDIG